METNYQQGIKNSTTPMKSAASDIQDSMSRVVDSVKKECSNVSEQASEYADRAVATAKDTGTALVSSIEDCVKAKPLQSMLTVAAAGYLLGRLFRH